MGFPNIPNLHDYRYFVNLVIDSVMVPWCIFEKDQKILMVAFAHESWVTHGQRHEPRKVSDN